MEKLPAADREFLFLRVNQRVWSDDQRRAYFSTLRNFAFEAARPPADLKKKLASLSVPTLVFWGEHDAVYAVAGGQELAGLQPGLRLVILPGMGHNIQQEAHQAILAELEHL